MDFIRNDKETGEAGIQQAFGFVEPRIVDDLSDARVSDRGDAALGHDRNAELGAVVEHSILLHVDAVSGEQLVEVMRVQRRTHGRIVGFHRHSAGKYREGFAAEHKELVNATQLLIRVVLLGLSDDETVEFFIDLGGAVRQLHIH